MLISQKSANQFVQTHNFVLLEIHEKKSSSLRGKALIHFQIKNYFEARYSFI